MKKHKGTFYEKHIKRILDLLISGSALILLSPVFIGVAIAVRKNLGSPVIFKQERPGKNGEIFLMYKFRSMKNSSKKDGKKLSDQERMTDFGRKLRATSLDEIPELFNIFKGDMSLIGPRPLHIDYLPYYSEEEMHRHDVLPGLTGLAQVNGRTAINWDERFKYDLDYVNKISFLVDFKIFILTIAKVVGKVDIKEPAMQCDFSKYRIKQWEEADKGIE